MTSVLVLNVTYEALGIVDFRRAIRLIFTGKAEVVEATAGEVRSTSLAVRLPSIVRMLYLIRRHHGRIASTRKRILMRDGYRCAYCGSTGGRAMTIDHVRPRSRGGKSTWENLVCACVACNHRKGNRTPDEAGMLLRIVAREPRRMPFAALAHAIVPSEWRTYLFVTHS
jgi:5-methylcytosine-specific restriction endonuclease McrA